MGVEEVSGAVQRHGGLAGAGAAGDDEHTWEVGADRLVLLGLDGGDDVAHATGAVPFERGEQRALARDFEAGGRDRLLVEDLVVEAGDLPALLGDQVAAADDPHRRDGRGPVERLRNRRPPVDDQRRVLVVLDREPPDVPGGTVVEVETAEHERGVADVEVGQAALGDVPGDVALQAGLVGPARAHVGIGGPHSLGGGPHGLEPGVRSIHVDLLGIELRIWLGTVRQHALVGSGRGFADGPA